MTDETNAVVIERTYTAPTELVWSMWTDAHHFAAWYGPMGATIPVAEMDVRVGGRRLICMEMQTPDGPMRMWFTGEYREVEAPRKLVYTEAMSDADGNVLDPAAMGMPDGHPAVTEITVEFEAREGGTWTRLTHAGVPADSPGAAGWRMALDKLEDRLAAQAGV